MLCVQPPISPDLSAFSPRSPRFGAHLRITTTTPTGSPSSLFPYSPSTPSPSALGKRPRPPTITVSRSSPVLVVNGPSPSKRFRASPSSPRPPAQFPVLGAQPRERQPRPTRGLRLNIPMSASLSPVDAGSPRRRASSSDATVTPGLIRSIQGVQLSVSPPPGGDDAKVSTPQRSPAPFPPKMSLRRSNPKGLSLSLAASFHNTSSSNETTPTPSAFCATPVSPAPDPTPLTPGPPKTPALANNTFGGQSLKTHSRRPSLLSVITHPAAPNALAVPPTPGAQSAAPYPYFPMRNRGHARMRSAGALLAAYGQQTEMDPRISQSAYPSVRGGFNPIDERNAQPAASSHTSATSATSASASASSASATDSMSSTPSTSPPLAPSSDERDLTYPSLLALEPYADGPIEIAPGVWLGAEDSLWFWDVWARDKASVAVINVAQEIENPFDQDAESDNDDRWARRPGANKPGVKLTTHEVAGQPIVEYAHLRWSHGEGGLADVPDLAALDDVASASSSADVVTQKHWRFWEAIRWLEERRRVGIPVLIHCQCGVSRSATLAVAYVMTLAAAGMEHDAIGHIKTMQDAYDYVKEKSPWIGPNVSLVFQLVEYARNLSSLLSSHVSGGGRQWKTQWPTLVDIETEDAWAARRREFGDDDDVASARSDEEARAEAEALDEAMAVRARRD